MSNATQAAFGLSWNVATFPFWSSLALLVSVLVYLRGWRALCRTRPYQIESWRVACFLTGMLTVWIAIASPLDTLSGVLLTAHMIQHLLLMAVAPPLIVLGAPMVPMLRGLPRYFVREGLGPLFTLRTVHAIERLLASRLFAWLAMNLCFLLWHMPSAYDLALRSPDWHEVEHASFLITSILFWWHIIAPWPTTYKASRWLLLPFLLTADFINTGISAALTFSGRVMYPFYANAPRFFGTSALNDQVAAGSLMWVLGSVSFLGAAMLLTLDIVSRKQDRRAQQMAVARARQIALQRRGEPSSLSIAARLRAIWADYRPVPDNPPAGAQAPSDARKGLDLMRVTGLGWFLGSRYGRQSLQAVSFLIAAVIIVDGLLGHQMATMNLAGILPWTYGRGIFVLGLVLCGNLFCMSCPFMLPRDAARWVLRKLGVQGLAWPRILRNKWIPVLLVPMFFWAYEGLDLWDSPMRTAVLLLGYFITAFAIDALFRDAAFCKYVCPLGQFNFVGSLVSPVQVAYRSAAVCGGCETRDCIAGRGAPSNQGAPPESAYQRGCELHLFQPLKQGSMDCTLCLDCVKACPHDNVGLFVLPPAIELAQIRAADPQRSGVGRYRDRTDIALLVATVVAAAFAEAAIMVQPVAAWMDRIGGRLSPLASTAAGIAVALALPVLLAGLTNLASRPAHASRRGDWPLWLLALLPVGIGMWAAHLSFHLVTGWNSVLPGLLQAGAELQKAGIVIHGLASPNWMIEQPLFGPGSLLGLQFALLDTGLLGTLYVGWRLTAPTQSEGSMAIRHAPESPGQSVAARATRLLPWAALAFLLYALGIWIFLEPMQMRGMVGM
jgi:cytochrome c oxidase assembly factor CtaG/polyferredoxin